MRSRRSAESICSGEQEEIKQALLGSQEAEEAEELFFDYFDGRPPYYFYTKDKTKRKRYEQCMCCLLVCCCIPCLVAYVGKILAWYKYDEVGDEIQDY